MALIYKDGKYYNSGANGSLNPVNPFLDMSPEEVADATGQTGTPAPYSGDNYWTGMSNVQNPSYVMALEQTVAPGVVQQGPMTPSSNYMNPSYGQQLENTLISQTPVQASVPVTTQPTAPTVPTAPNTGTDPGYGIPAGGGYDPGFGITNGGQMDWSQVLALLNSMQPQAPAPQMPQMPTYQDPSAFYQTIISSLLSGGQQAQGSQEPFLPSSSNAELSQAIQDRAMQMLNTTPGYTDAETALIYENARNQFNMGQEEDLRTLENLYQKYGLNQGAGLGGQAGNSLQDYFGKRAMAQSNLDASIAQSIADRRMSDQSQLFGNALNANQQLYSQVRGDFADTMAMAQFQEAQRTGDFDRALEAMRFMSDESQRQFANQLGISQLELEEYWRERGYTDDMTLKNLEYWQQATGLTPADIMQALTWAGTNEASVLSRGMGTPESVIPTLMAIAMMGQQNGWGGNTPTNPVVNGITDAVSKTADDKVNEALTAAGATVGSIASVAAPIIATIGAVAGWTYLFSKMIDFKKTDTPRPPEEVFYDNALVWIDSISQSREDLNLTDQQKNILAAAMVNEWKTTGATGEEIAARFAPGGGNMYWASAEPLGGTA